MTMKKDIDIYCRCNDVEWEKSPPKSGNDCLYYDGQCPRHGHVQQIFVEVEDGFEVCQQ